jgi:hypothetical protein
MTTRPPGGPGRGRPWRRPGKAACRPPPATGVPAAVTSVQIGDAVQGIPMPDESMTEAEDTELRRCSQAGAAAHRLLTGANAQRRDDVEPDH